MCFIHSHETTQCESRLMRFSTFSLKWKKYPADSETLSNDFKILKANYLYFISCKRMNEI